MAIIPKDYNSVERKIDRRKLWISQIDLMLKREYLDALFKIKLRAEKMLLNSQIAELKMMERGER